jgi:hypothetical protein
VIRDTSCGPGLARSRNVGDVVLPLSKDAV